MPPFRTAPLPVALIVAAALVFGPTSVHGQAPEPGSRVRLTHAGGARHQGTLQLIEADSARVAEKDGRVVALSLADVERIEVSLGRQRQFWRNFGLTTLGMSALGGGVGAATWTPCEAEGWLSCMFVPESRGQAMLAGAVVGGLVGIPVGIVVGAAVRREQWRPVQPDGIRPRQLSVRPIVGNRIGASATLLF